VVGVVGAANEDAERDSDFAKMSSVCERGKENEAAAQAE
jgi:hypothetical protein